MVRDPRAFPWDARASGDAIGRFLFGKRFDDYLADEMLRSGVERQFEILGEALAQLSKTDPKLAARIPNASNAIGFRNVLIDGYAKVDSAIVWQAATQKACRSSYRLSMRYWGSLESECANTSGFQPLNLIEIALPL